MHRKERLFVYSDTKAAEEEKKLLPLGHLNPLYHLLSTFCWFPDEKVLLASLNVALWYGGDGAADSFIKENSESSACVLRCTVVFVWHCHHCWSLAVEPSRLCLLVNISVCGTSPDTRTAVKYFTSGTSTMVLTVCLVDGAIPAGVLVWMRVWTAPCMFCTVDFIRNGLCRKKMSSDWTWSLKTGQVIHANILYEQKNGKRKCWFKIKSIL